MAFTLNKKNGKPLTDIDGKDNQLNKEEAQDVGISNDEFEQLDTDNTGKLSDAELEDIPQTFTDQSNGETQLPNTINDPEKGMYAGSTLNKDMAGVLNQGALPQSEAPFLGANDEKDHLNFKLHIPQLKSTPLSLDSHISEKPTEPFKKLSTPFDDAKSTIATLAKPVNQLNDIKRSGNILQSIIEHTLSNPNTRGGHMIDTPETDSASSTGASSGITTSKFNTGSTTALFKDIMSGKHTPLGTSKVKGIPVGKEKKGEESVGKPLKLKSTKQENLYERIVDKVIKSYKDWPTDKTNPDQHIREKGLIALYAKKDWISIKYGSYRKVLLDTFAKAHPELLTRIWEIVQ